ncbi:hypothetical protein, partial [Umezakia ovalisporum]|uniref:hypothetical protein n=1 Tax=Umezakia ovalisporum TaxID=75695 RepID=UPI0039C5E9D7
MLAREACQGITDPAKAVIDLAKERSKKEFLQALLAKFIADANSMVPLEKTVRSALPFELKVLVWIGHFLKRQYGVDLNTAQDETYRIPSLERIC